MSDNRICRLCLQKSKNLLNVFCRTLKEGNAHAKIHKYCCIDITQEDSFSKYVCLNCLRKIEEFHSFCEQVKQNQERFCYLKQQQQDVVFESIEKLNMQTPDVSISCGDLIFNENNFVVDIKSEELQNACTDVQYNSNLKSFGNNAELTSYAYLSKIQNKSTLPLNDLVIGDWNDNDSNSIDYEGTQLNDETSELPFSKSHAIDIKFPSVLIKDEKFVVHGKSLINLITRFFKLSCDLCTENKSHESLASLFSHYKHDHLIRGYVVCCGAKFTKLRRMALHMARHIQPEAFSCKECGKVMTSPRILRYHIQNHLPEEKRPLRCSQCPRRFSYSSALTAHQICHLPVEQRDSHVCDECGKTFITSGRLTKHINTAHISNNQMFVCHTCGKQFNCKGNFNYHLATHEKFHQVQCETCGKWLKNKLCLRKHMAQHSTIRHNCVNCNYSTVNRQCLQNHMRVRHSNEKPFTCEECGRDFKLKNTLINHLVQHTGERRYTCEFCSKQFASSGNYYAHRKRMHPNELAELNQKKEEEMRKYREMAMEKGISHKSCNI